MVATIADAAMAHAIDLASRGLGSTSPNPVVGAVVLDAAGEIAGAGWHARYGGAHAEVAALAAAGPLARGGTMVSTLEPCATTGRTGPCTEAMLTAGIAKVVYAVADPTEAGGGAALLRGAGVEVVAGVGDEAAARGNEAWLLAQRLGRPFVTWKFGGSLDGRTAAADGTSRWITGPEARADVHALRSQVDAVLVGAGTVLADDPQLTVRDADGVAAPRQPLRVVADRRRRVPRAARIFDDTATTLASTAADPESLLAEVFARGVRHVLLEGGAILAGAFVRERLVDRVMVYVAPVLLGDGSPVMTAAGIETIGQARRLRIDDVTTIGSDVRITARPEKEG